MNSQPSKPAKIGIVSDQAIYLRGLEQVALSLSGFDLVGEGRSALDALQLCNMSLPDLLVLDLKNLLDQGRDTVLQIHQRWPSIKLVLLIRTQEEGHAQDVFDTLPLFTLSRDMTEDEFKAALIQIHQAVYQPGSQPNGEGETVFFTSAPGGETSEELITRELVMAGRIQSDILPEAPPVLAGWDIAARLEPARETSGDFYDFIPLGDRKLGLVMADVTDKGIGAALFMALSSTLLRTYATRYPNLPALALSTVSERILTDTRGSMFVTTFYGVLEPYTGRFVYANAGHPPPYLISTRHGGRDTNIDRLRPTGMALGVDERATWKQKYLRMVPGDYLVLYTDGITEAQNAQGDFFGEERLVDSVLARTGGTARDVLQALLDEVHRFVGSACCQDDIAVIVVRRVD